MGIEYVNMEVLVFRYGFELMYSKTDKIKFATSLKKGRDLPMYFSCNLKNSYAYYVLTL